MAKFDNVSGALRILPDGTKIPNGGSVDLDEKVLENVGIQMWINDGDLVEVDSKKSKSETKKSDSNAVFKADK